MRKHGFIARVSAKIDLCLNRNEKSEMFSIKLSIYLINVTLEHTGREQCVMLSKKSVIQANISLSAQTTLEDTAERLSRQE